MPSDSTSSKRPAARKPGEQEGAGESSGSPPPKPASAPASPQAPQHKSNVKLSAEEIETRLEPLADWTQSGESLQRTLGFKDFVAAMAFVNRIAAIAESLNHHPDILVRYNKVTLTLSTHDAGGITAKDFGLARAIENA